MSGRIAITGVLGTLLVCFAGFVDYEAQYFCLNDSYGYESVYCKEGGAPHVWMPLVGIFVALALVVVVTTVFAAKRGRFWPVWLVAVVCASLTLVLPELLLPR